MLMKKIGTLAKALEVESKKVKREAAIREKDSALTKVDEKMRNTNSSKRLAIYTMIFSLALQSVHDTCMFYHI